MHAAETTASETSESTGDERLYDVIVVWTGRSDDLRRRKTSLSRPSGHVITADRKVGNVSSPTEYQAGIDIQFSRSADSRTSPPEAARYSIRREWKFVRNQLVVIQRCCAWDDE